MIGMLFRVGLLTTLVGGSTLALVGPERMKGWFADGKDSILSAVDDARGMEAKLRSIRREIGDLDQESRRLREEAVRRRVESEQLRSDIAQREAELGRKAQVLDRVSSLLAEPKPQYVIGRVVFARHEVESDAADKLSVYNVQTETLKSLKETLATKEKAQAIAEENVARAAALRADLASKIQLLEARLQKYRAKEAFAATVEETVDFGELDSDLARARQAIADFERDLEVKDRMLEERLKGGVDQPHEGIDYEVLETEAVDLVGQIRAALHGADGAVPPADDAVARAAR